MRLAKSIAALMSGMAGLGIQGTGHAAPTKYTAERLGVGVYIADMNNKGEIIGRQGGENFRWSLDDNGRLNKEQLLPKNAFLNIYDINDRGEVLTSAGLYNTHTKELSAIPGKTNNAIGYGIVNDKGEIVVGSGVIFIPTPTSDAKRITGGKKLPAGFNNNGVVVDSDGIIWDVHSGIKLQDKPKDIDKTYQPFDLNENNQVLFSSFNKGISFLYDCAQCTDGKRRELNIFGLDMDNNGNVVGSIIGSKEEKAAIWLAETNSSFDLNAYISDSLMLKNATHINDLGWIVAENVTGREKVSYLLRPVPVPVPATGLLLLSSLLGFFALQRDRIKTALKMKKS